MTYFSVVIPFSALKRIVSDIEEPQQAAWVVFFKRLWVGRHARYPCERIEALQKWNFHWMSPLITYLCLQFHMEVIMSHARVFWKLCSDLCHYWNCAERKTVILRRLWWRLLLTVPCNPRHTWHSAQSQFLLWPWGMLAGQPQPESRLINNVTIVETSRSFFSTQRHRQLLSGG